MNMIRCVRWIFSVQLFSVVSAIRKEIGTNQSHIFSSYKTERGREREITLETPVEEDKANKKGGT